MCAAGPGDRVILTTSKQLEYDDGDKGKAVSGTEERFIKSVDGATVTLDAPLAKLPLLVRAGHLVPLLDPAIDTLAEETSASIVSPPDVADVYDVVGALAPGATDARFTLYDGGTLHANAADHLRIDRAVKRGSLDIFAGR